MYEVVPSSDDDPSLSALSFSYFPKVKSQNWLIICGGRLAKYLGHWSWNLVAPHPATHWIYFQVPWEFNSLAALCLLSWLVCLLPVGVLQAMRLWSFTVFISNFFELIVWKNCYYPIREFSSPRSLLDTLCFLFAFYLETFWWPCFCLFAHGWMCFLFWKKGKSCRLCCDHIEHLDFMDR